MNQQKNFLKKCPPIQKSSDEWKVIQFKLQLSIGTTALNINRIYDISNTHVSASFSSYAKGSIVLQSFIQTDKLVDQNRLQKVIQKGFDITQQEGMVFNVGYNRNIDVRAQKEFSFVMCKIAVGKSYCYSQRKYKQQAIELPQGFDSIYLYSEQQSPQVFLHKYVIFKNYQVYPSYLIDFSIDSYKEQQSKHPLCDNCAKIPPNQAKLYCITEQAHFCMDCDLEYHAGKLSSKHQRVDIAEKPKKFGLCTIHQEKLELYCSVCFQALCVNCKINGDHVSGEMGQHQLLKLKDAYSDISSKVKQIQPNIQRRKNQLTQDLRKIDLKIKQVNDKATHVQQQIYSHFHKALKQLQVQTQKKLSFLIGDQLQLKRQYDHIQWMQSFLKYSLEVQQPHQFLHSWYKYSKYKKQVLSLANLSINTEVKADMKLQGSIHVVVESKKKKGGPQASMPLNMMTMSLGPQQMKQPLQPNTSSNPDLTPVKSNQNTLDKDMGTTQLRKTVFKKHYSDNKSRFLGQPGTMKGNYDNRNLYPSNEK